MTRAQRRTRTAKLRAASAGLSTDFRVMPSIATENPNDGKRHVAPATARRHGLTAHEAESIEAARRDYRPLTVRTPIKRARIEPRTTSYLI